MGIDKFVDPQNPFDQIYENVFVYYTLYREIYTTQIPKKEPGLFQLRGYYRHKQGKLQRIVFCLLTDQWLIHAIQLVNVKIFMDQCILICERIQPTCDQLL